LKIRYYFNHQEKAVHVLMKNRIFIAKICLAVCEPKLSCLALLSFGSIWHTVSFILLPWVSIFQEMNFRSDFRQSATQWSFGTVQLWFSHSCLLWNRD